MPNVFIGHGNGKKKIAIIPPLAKGGKGGFDISLPKAFTVYTIHTCNNNN